MEIFSVPQENKPIVVGEYYDSADEKQAFLRQVFDDTAKHYEFIAKWGWFGSGDWYRKQALLRNGVTRDMRVLDVATGTGQVARALLKIVEHADQIECVEPSARMIEESRKTVPAVHHCSTAERLPVADGQFDFLTMGFALRHVDSLEQSFSEFRRVLKDGGTVLIMDVTVPRRPVPRFFFRMYFKYFLPVFSGLLTRDRNSYRLMRYYWESMNQMVAIDDVLDSLRGVGFTQVQHKALLGCFSEYTARR